MSQEQRKEASIFRLLRYSSRVNDFKIHSHNSYKHEKLKFDLAYLLMRSGHKVVTEAIFKDYPGRGDVLDLTTGFCYEIMHTEKMDNIEEKRLKYPPEVFLVPIKASDIPLKELKEFLGYED